MSLGPPFPGETLVLYEGTKLYWDIVDKSQQAQYPPTLNITLPNGNIVKVNLLTGAIIP
jgi:hypothetical protein